MTMSNTPSTKSY